MVESTMFGAAMREGKSCGEPWPDEIVSRCAALRIALRFCWCTTARAPLLYSFCFSGGDPTFKDINPFLRPRAVARHRSAAKALENCHGMFAHIGVRPKVEGELHRLPIALTKERSDMFCERDDIVGAGKD